MFVRVAAAVVVAGMSIAVAQAHHAIGGIYDASRRLTFDGAITAFHFVNPHPFVEFDVRDASGRAQRWRGEMDNRFELVGVGMTAETLRPGDRIAITGSAARDGGRSMYVRSLERSADGFRYEQVGSSPRVRMPSL